MILTYLKIIFLSAFFAAILDLVFYFLINPSLILEPVEIRIIIGILFYITITGVLIVSIYAIPVTHILNKKKIKINFLKAILIGCGIPLLIDLYSMYDMKFSEVGLWITYPAVIHTIAYYYIAKKYKIIK